MPTDTDLRSYVRRELEWEPSLDERRIGVLVDDGIVTLTGEVTSYVERWKAERTIERLRGVRGFVDELTVRSASNRADSDQAEAAADALPCNGSAHEGSVKVKIDQGSLTPEGDDWLDRLGARRHTFAHLSREALQIAEGLGSDPAAAPSAAVLLSLASTFDRLAGAFGTAHAVGTSVRGRPLPPYPTGHRGVDQAALKVLAATPNSRGCASHQLPH